MEGFVLWTRRWWDQEKSDRWLVDGEMEIVESVTTLKDLLSPWQVMGQFISEQSPVFKPSSSPPKHGHAEQSCAILMVMAGERTLEDIQRSIPIPAKKAKTKTYVESKSTILKKNFYVYPSVQMARFVPTCQHSSLWLFFLISFSASFFESPLLRPNSLFKPLYRH